MNISFVIPAYNCASTLEESIESILDGNFENGDEIIIVNDYSSDDTKKIISKLKIKYPFIIHIDNPINRGCPATRNVGIRAAKNPLIFNLDSDNVLAHKSIMALKNYLQSNDADMAAFSEDRYFEQDVRKITHKWVYDSPIMSLADFLAGPISPGPGGNFMYTKKSWEKIGGYWEYGKGLHEAWGFTLKQLANGAKFVVLPKSFYFHRYGHASLFVTESKKKNESSMMATKMLANFIGLIKQTDAEYITSREGSITWFENFSPLKPLRLKTGEVGKSGYKINIERHPIINKLKKYIPRPMFIPLKKVYLFIK